MGVIARMAQRTAVVAPGRQRSTRGRALVQGASARRLQLELHRLTDLRDQQLLTHDEFVLARAKLLGAC